MNIIITKQNENFFKELIPRKKLNVVDQTANTLTIRISQNVFNSLFQKVISSGNNPYALMAW